MGFINELETKIKLNFSKESNKK